MCDASVWYSVRIVSDVCERMIIKFSLSKPNLGDGNYSVVEEANADKDSDTDTETVIAIV